MACVTSITFQSPLPGGSVVIGGVANVGTYATDGATLDLSNYIKSTTSPIVTISGGSGYVAEHNKGTAAAGKVIMRLSHLNAKNGIDQNIVLGQAANALDMSAVQVSFMAMGQAY